MDDILLREAESVEKTGGQDELDLNQVGLHQLYVRSQTVVSRRVAGETLIVPIRGKVGDLASIYSFNGSGSLIWQTLETPKALPALIDAVLQEYEVDHEQAAADVQQFVGEMLAVGLVEARHDVSMAAMNTAAQPEIQSSSSR